MAEYLWCHAQVETKADNRQHQILKQHFTRCPMSWLVVVDGVGAGWGDTGLEYMMDVLQGREVLLVTTRTHAHAAQRTHKSCATHAWPLRITQAPTLDYYSTYTCNHIQYRPHSTSITVLFHVHQLSCLCVVWSFNCSMWRWEAHRIYSATTQRHLETALHHLFPESSILWISQ